MNELQDGELEALRKVCAAAGRMKRQSGALKKALRELKRAEMTAFQRLMEKDVARRERRFVEELGKKSPWMDLMKEKPYTEGQLRKKGRRWLFNAGFGKTETMLKNIVKGCK